MRKQLLFAFVVLLIVQDVYGARNMMRSHLQNKSSTKNNAKVTKEDNACVSEDYVFDEGPKGNRCESHCDCDGARTCSGYGWCQGTSRTEKSQEPEVVAPEQKPEDPEVPEEPKVPCPDPETFDYEGQLEDLYKRIHKLKDSFEANKDELVALSEGRCTANMLFIEALKEHRIAIDIVGQLIDMSANFDVMSGEPSSFAQKEALQRFQTNLIAISMSQDKEAGEIVNKIFDKMSMLEMPDQSEIYDLMHKTSENAKIFGSLVNKMKKSPHNLQKILAHMSITNKNQAKDDEVSYSDLDFDEFDAPEMKKVKEIEFTPVDMEKLRGDLGALLTALQTHLKESMEDLIEREIAAAMAFADWRYDMEEESYYFSDNLDGLIEQVKDIRELEMACVDEESAHGGDSAHLHDEAKPEDNP